MSGYDSVRSSFEPVGGQPFSAETKYMYSTILPAIGLGNEPPEPDIMMRPPRRRTERLVSLKTFLRSYGIVGPAEAALSFVVFFLILAAGGWGWGERLSASNTLYRQAAGGFLAAIVFSQIGNVMACRTNRQSAIRHVVRYNSWITAGVAVELVFIFAILYLPVATIHHFFSTAPLPLGIWPVIALTPFVIFGMEEIRKFVVRRGVNRLSA